MKNVFALILIALTSAVSPPPAAPLATVGTNPIQLDCNSIEPLLHQLASYVPKPDNPETETRRECFDGKDNDEDGMTDCQDPDCLKDKRIQQRCIMLEMKGK